MDHITIKLVKKNKAGTIMGDDCSNEFDYFSGKQRIKRFRKIENTKKLFAIKLRLPKVKMPKVFKTFRVVKTSQDLVLKTIPNKTKENAPVSISILDLNKCKEHRMARQNQHECARCIFGDPSFSCSCDFRSSSPDFKLYDDDVQFIYYHNAFFC